MLTCARIALLIFLSLYCLPNCGARDKTAVVVGRLIIKHPVKGVYKKDKRLYFTERFDKRYTHLIKRKDSGYFRMRLPLGYSYLEKLHYFDILVYLKKLPSDYLEIRLDSADRVYYIGDIVLTWDIAATSVAPNDARVAGGILGGVVGYSIGSSIQRDQEGRIPPEAVPVSVTVNPETVTFFAEKLDLDKEILLTAPVRIKKYR